MREYKGRSLSRLPLNYTIIDLETTGFSPKWDKIIEIGAIKVRDGLVVDEFSSLVNSPDVYVGDTIQQLTGISQEMVAGAPEIGDVLCEIDTFIGDDPLIGHNVHFDINFLYDNFEIYLKKPLSNNYIDVLSLSRKLLHDVPDHKLQTLVEYFEIDQNGFHRASWDCYSTKAVYDILRDMAPDVRNQEDDILHKITIDENNPFYNQRIVMKGIPQLYSFEFYEAVAEKCRAHFSNVFYASTQIAVLGEYTYKRYINGQEGTLYDKARTFVEEGKLQVFSEKAFCEALNIPVPIKVKSPGNSAKESKNLRAKDFQPSNDVFDEGHPLFGKMFVFTGTLEKMSRKVAMQYVVDCGGLVGDSITKNTNYLVLGNNDYCTTIRDGKSSKQKKAEKYALEGHDISIISEDVFYEMLDHE